MSTIEVSAAPALEIDLGSPCQINVNGQDLHIPHKEYSLLAVLAKEPTRVWTKEQLLREVWGFRSLSNTRTLDSHACRLRAKLTEATGHRYIENVWAVGYRLCGSEWLAGGVSVIGGVRLMPKDESGIALDANMKLAAALLAVQQLEARLAANDSAASKEAQASLRAIHINLAWANEEMRQVKRAVRLLAEV